ncbi:nicotinamidase [Grimontia sp. NTOU-MAR1]|uniref:nicotinamidase n=1 Tax=Grimontia sp. NTOU-MAR1 TaxID=3111011 RepID=UPI002DB8129F|nr:nicotinamidase [Grimontia sp. NTOU-MAR1]WRV96560.1 nicotinamidase [Grimontia sp. NTOU-MAR1]
MIASIDVDPQKTFTPICPGELPVDGGDKIAPALNEQAKKASFRVLTKDAHPVNAVWVVDSHNKMLAPLEHANADLTWVSHAVPGTEGFEIIPGLPDVTEYDHVIWKGVEPDLHPYGACFHDIQEKLSTGLIEWLKAKEVTTVLVGGLATDYCVKTTAMQLKMYGDFDVWVNLEACRGITEETTETGCAQMRDAGIHVIATLEEFRA